MIPQGACITDPVCAPLLEMGHFHPFHLWSFGECFLRSEIYYRIYWRMGCNLGCLLLVPISNLNTISSAIEEIFWQQTHGMAFHFNGSASAPRCGGTQIGVSFGLLVSASKSPCAHAGLNMSSQSISLLASGFCFRDGHIIQPEQANCTL